MSSKNETGTYPSFPVGAAIIAATMLNTNNYC